jgi:hypothetical protein
VATRTADAKSEAALPVGWPKPKTPVVSAPPAPVLALMLERPALPQAIVRTREACSTYGMDGLDGFIGTFSGLRFWPLDLNPEKILVEDIAHALAHQCRFGGHASKFYSVAEHSVHVSQLCPAGDALWGLLHDASEAYLVDLPRPLKQLPEFAPYREAEHRLQRAVAVRFGLAPEQPASVTEADDTMLWIEAHSLLGSMPVEVIRDTRPPFEITDPLLPVEAERLFLARFKELSAQNPHPCRTSQR